MRQLETQFLACLHRQVVEFKRICAHVVRPEDTKRADRKIDRGARIILESSSVVCNYRSVLALEVAPGFDTTSEHILTLIGSVEIA